MNDDGTVAVNDYLQTAYPGILACGDAAGPWQFTHMASWQAWFASVNALVSPWWKFRIHYRQVPRTTYTDPEVARVGLDEGEARARGVAFETVRYDLDDLDRAIADSETLGFIKVLTVPGKDRIIGVTIVGSHAAELLAEFTFAMTHGLGLKRIMSTIHVYPSYSESNRFAAARWRERHAPAWLYPWLERFHKFRRGKPE